MKWREIDKNNEYEWAYWETRLGSEPIKEVVLDFSGSYEMEKHHLVALENGTYAVIKEEGCSCYNPENAEIEKHRTLDRAKDAFEKSCDSLGGHSERRVQARDEIRRLR